jgi:hypothetical protein
MHGCGGIYLIGMLYLIRTIVEIVTVKPDAVIFSIAPTMMKCDASALEIQHHAYY